MVRILIIYDHTKLTQTQILNFAKSVHINVQCKVTYIFLYTEQHKDLELIITRNQRPPNCDSLHLQPQ